MSRFRPRWYTGSISRKGPFVAVQAPGSQARLPKEIALVAYAEYAAQGHGGQSFDEIQQRCGFSWGEVVMLLADALERERAAHSTSESEEED